MVERGAYAADCWVVLPWLCLAWIWMNMVEKVSESGVFGKSSAETSRSHIVRWHKQGSNHVQQSLGLNAHIPMMIPNCSRIESLHAIAREEYTVSHCTGPDKTDAKDGRFAQIQGRKWRQETCRNMSDVVNMSCVYRTAATGARSELLRLPCDDCLAGGSGRAGAVTAMPCHAMLHDVMWIESG